MNLRLGHVLGWLGAAAIVALALDARGQTSPAGFELFEWPIGAAGAATAWESQREGAAWAPVPAFVRQDGRVWGVVEKDPLDRILRIRGVDPPEVGEPSPWSRPACPSDLDGDGLVTVTDWVLHSDARDRLIADFGLSCLP